jgi:hypothetical protein
MLCFVMNYLQNFKDLFECYFFFFIYMLISVLK